MDYLISQNIVFDAIITDPPYGITVCRWDSVIPFDEMWKRLNKLIKPNGAIVLFGSEPFSSALRISNLKMFRYDWIWEKNKSSNFIRCNWEPMKKHEIISVFSKKRHFYQPQKKKIDRIVKSVGGNHIKTHSGSVVSKAKLQPRKEIFPDTILTYKTESKPQHPTQKPEALMEYLIKTYTIKGERILDFTMGIGSTGVAAINTGRKFVGIEIEKDYFNIAKERILSLTKQPFTKH
ncbi:MAG TPA: site-specific DNA-methyltransferase [Bacteroidales bacterium]|nr:site-specific DNA-methyltransferase [Bacteroidales bacterium]